MINKILKLLRYFFQNTKHFISFWIIWISKEGERVRNDALSKNMNNIFFLKITLINNLSLVNASSVSVFVLSYGYSYQTCKPVVYYLSIL